MNRFPPLLLCVLTLSFLNTSPTTAQALSPTRSPTSPPASSPVRPPANYCLPAAQMRVVDTAIQQFEALKPVVVRLQQANGHLRRANSSLRAGLTQADSSRAFALRSLGAQGQLTRWKHTVTELTAKVQVAARKQDSAVRVASRHEARAATSQHQTDSLTQLYEQVPAAAALRSDAELFEHLAHYRPGPFPDTLVH